MPLALQHVLNALCSRLNLITLQGGEPI